MLDRLARLGIALLCGSAVLVGASAASAAAADATKVAVVPLQLDGKLGPDVQANLQGAVVKGLESEELSVVGPDSVGDVGACGGGECVPQVASSADAPYVVVPHVAASGRDYEIKIELYNSSGKRLATKEGSCEICSLREVQTVVADQTAALRGQVELLAGSPPQLRVTSEPPGATVFLDGEEIGTTPLETEVGPGEHVIEVKKDGHQGRKQTVESSAGSTENVAFQLVAAERPKKKESNFPLRPVGWAAVGTGAALAIAGIPLMAIDERPYKKTCDGDNKDADGTCRFRYNTLTGGIVLFVSGVVIAGTGVGLLVYDRKRRGKDDSDRATVKLGVGTQGLIVSGRF